MSDERYTVRLGSHTYEVMPQPLPVLKHDLGPRFEQLVNTDVAGAGGMVDFFMRNAHGLLSAFIEDLMPLHEWEGYPSEEAHAAGNFDRQYAKEHSPTGPQIKLAGQVVLKANGLDVWETLKDLMGPQALREFLTNALAEGSRSMTSPSDSLPQESASTTSTTTSDETAPASLSVA